MMAPAARPKYRAALEARLRRMAAELERERVWLGISCGYTGATMESMNLPVAAPSPDLGADACKLAR